MAVTKKSRISPSQPCGEEARHEDAGDTGAAGGEENCDFLEIVGVEHRHSFRSSFTNVSAMITKTIGSLTRLGIIDKPAHKEPSV